MNIHHKLMEAFGQYSGAPSELRVHNILVEQGIASENTAMLFMCFYGAIRQTNMATDSFNIYLSPVGAKSLLIGKRAPNLSGMCANTMVS